MPVNNKPCGQCAHYDQQHIQSTKGFRREVYGFCVKLSVYPAGDAKGQIEGKVVPAEAQRAERGEPGKMKIVYPKTVVGNCIHFLDKAGG